MPLPVEYYSIDHARLDRYLSQLEIDRSFFKKWGIDLGFSLGGVTIGASPDFDANNRDEHKKLIRLLKLLRKAGALLNRRPNSYDEIYFSENVFVHEKYIEADRLLLKVAESPFSGLESLVVWVSMPQLPMKNLKWDADGSVLLLIESFWEDDRYSGMVSGCSALQWIILNVLGKDRSEIVDYDRQNYDTPTEKLVAAGAEYLGTRAISTLYRKRYMTNEQIFAHDNDTTRCFDIVGYPIYIASKPIS